MAGSNCKVAFVFVVDGLEGSRISRSRSRAGLSACRARVSLPLWGWLVFRAREAEKKRTSASPAQRARRARLKPHGHGTQKGDAMPCHAMRDATSEARCTSGMSTNGSTKADFYLRLLIVEFFFY